MKNRYNEILNRYNQLTNVDKYHMFMQYYINQLASNHTIHILNIKPKEQWLQSTVHDINIPSFKGNIIRWGTFTYSKIESVDDYCDSNRIKLEDHGDNWKEKGWATKFTLTTSGIYSTIKKQLISDENR